VEKKYVRIEKATELDWYRHRIGEVHEVIEEDDTFYMIKEVSADCYFLCKSDCVEISEEKSKK
jgi:hypothetical protein